ncbi:MAG: DUF4445 domain-containing protein [Chitinivibrionales bacterium]|nr:DUF4445 domain-containing protein [Chitinivibrionales bacterium]
MAAKQFHNVTFLPENKTIRVEHLKSIFETILDDNPQNIELTFACGSEGICQKCKIRSFQKMGPMTPTEKGCLSDQEIARGVRLACQARVIQDMQAEIIYKKPFTITLVDEPVSNEGIVNPGLKKLYVESGRGGALSCERFIELVQERMPQNADVRQLPSEVTSRFEHFFTKDVRGCTAVFIDNELICLEEGDTTDKKSAIAVDLGTNTLVASLVDLGSGKKIAVVTDTNPQIDIGADLESRITMVADDPFNLEILNEAILLRIDILITELCRAAGVSPQFVYEIAVSGTTGMLHLFLKGIPGMMEQQSLLESRKRMSFSAEQAFIKSSSRALFHTLPVISSYVGADIIAGLLATRLHRSQETLLLLDLGSDIKAVLHHKGKIVAASTPDAGAFECTGIRFGMRPETGAVEQVRLASDVHLGVIGESLPRGICGSGLIELAAELKRNGIVSEQGDFMPDSPPVLISPSIAKRIITSDGETGFLLYTDYGEFDTDIYVCRSDINLLRQSKARAAALVDTVLSYAGIRYDNVDQVLIGGSFGQRIDVAAFVEIGLVPSSHSDRLMFVGNTAKKGTQMVLLDRSILDEAESLAHKVECISHLQNADIGKYMHFLPYFSS